jgi:hypothetical protein
VFTAGDLQETLQKGTWHFVVPVDMEDKR